MAALRALGVGRDDPGARAEQTAWVNHVVRVANSALAGRQRLAAARVRAHDATFGRLRYMAGSLAAQVVWRALEFEQTGVLCSRNMMPNTRACGRSRGMIFGCSRNDSVLSYARRTEHVLREEGGRFFKATGAHVAYARADVRRMSSRALDWLWLVWWWLGPDEDEDWG